MSNISTTSVEMTTNKALFADKSKHVSVRELPIPEPGADEVLVEVLYTGINPSDIRHPKFLEIANTVIGDDFCGKVVKSNSIKFQVDDIIAGFTPASYPRPVQYGTHQAYVCCPDNMCYNVPDNLPHDHAAALNVVAMTAADTLFNLFSFPLLTANESKLPGPLLVWGASTSVGVCVIQYARASRCPLIVAVASPSRHKLLRELGAIVCFDYSSATVVEDIQAAVRGTGKGPIRYALDAVGTTERPTSAEMVKRCIDKKALAASVIHRLDRRFQFPLAMTLQNFYIKPWFLPFKLKTPAWPADQWRAWEALQWAIQEYGDGFQLPVVKVIEGRGEDILRRAERIAEGKGGFGKTVVRQPMQ
jgi:NADPH:quinone reductase-like Zn-dependent oxidoreductase